MCLGVPVQIEDIVGGRGLVRLDGLARWVSLDLIEAPAPGDYVSVHAGLAWERLAPEEAAEILAAIALACTVPAPPPPDTAA